MSNDIWVVIPAAGVGSRMQADRPKQYLSLLGKTVIEQTLACFTKRSDIAGIVVVTSATDPYWNSLDLPEAKPIYRCSGGKERCDSVLSALTYLRDNLSLANDVTVLVHDAARPCLSDSDLDKLLQTNPQQTALLAMPVRDTMKREQAGESVVSHTEDRTGLWHALTPQMATLGLLHKALTQAFNEDMQVTDEASALEYMGLQPVLVEGEASNIKITRPADLALAEFFLSQQR